MSMRKFADHVIAVANLEGDRISNLQLQKIMYFAVGDFIIENGITPQLRRMYDEPFEAWTYGPVVRSQYFRFSGFGRYPIFSDGNYDVDYEDFDKHIIKYLDENINVLVEESHEHSTWWNNKEKIARQEKVVYSLENIANDFSE
ncbi:hypothetical protein J40TS1_33920 [Paenibacillus montaniterrae]|uniref:Antitoxin SocA-like Panacea domain-containing protein n=1 Tax=Paenibacillus montaniterrae TaxID=429341 RepID=A0A920CYT6_9BACL|nr:hypothetical protein [Paenibacillus montaniterrae]GIP17750.1 hypothetical protein J40TS1_33920 [Paenibacillus montaniterrae]